MLNLTPNRWLLNALCAIPVGAGVEMVYKTPADPLAFAGCSLMVIGTVLIIGNETHGILNRIEQLSSYSSRSTVEDRIREAREQPTSPLKLVSAMPKINYGQVLNMPKIDRERELAKTLNDMRTGGFKMNISESYWIRDAHWKDSPEAFRATRGKWEHYQIVGKKRNATNSPYEVLNEGAIELIASGKLKLPTPPGMD